MKFLRKKLFKLGNKGMSMVELLCGITILSIIGTSISGVLVVSADGYNRGSAEASVQQEAQLVANQVSDLLIDATADVTYASNVLKVKQGDKGYQVTYDATAQTLTYQEFSVDAADNWTSSSDAQLMADGLQSFSVDVSDFATNGYARLEMQFKNASQEYPTSFTITARNKEAKDATAVVAAIFLPSEIILEPDESYNFASIVSTSGLSNTNLNWSVTGNNSASTTVISGSLHIGTDETANMVRLKVESQQLDGGGNPLAQKTVNVYIRRVTTLDVNGVLESGVAYKAGAVYRLSASIGGTNLAQALGTDYDLNYVTPYQATWTVSDSTVGHIEVDAIDSTKAKLVLDQDMADGTTLTVRAKAKHPDGTNKTGTDYGDVYDDWQLVKTTPYITTGSGWLRQTNQEQAAVDGNVHALKASLPGEGKKHVFKVRYREYPSGTWTEWKSNQYGDADDSMSINLRPLFTSVMDYDKDYEVQIKLVIQDNTGTEIWPTAGIPEESYMISEVVKRVQLTFDSSLLGLNAALSNDESSAPDIAFSRDNQSGDILSIHEVIGIDTNGTSIDNAYKFELEKKQADGTWGAVAGQTEISSNQGKLRLTFRHNDFEGNYRVKVSIKDMNIYEMNGNNIVQTGVEDYVLYDEATGEGIFYFNAVK
ncbi:MAG: hypothetical protein J6C84_07275 [Lachnospiraceae bacterium]|nr:hypothetical protein [Lachnospiraceae bacterium]